LRSSAVAHYKAAEQASESLHEAKAAAEQGLQKPYEPPNHAQKDQPRDEQEKK